ncbi:hypothetical protein JYT28_01690, partial [Desulfobulbus sp. AH-315-M07]|nr:hypothetical protein [Desulfobulbus sp. AH-315-M07]
MRRVGAHARLAVRGILRLVIVSMFAFSWIAACQGGMVTATVDGLACVGGTTTCSDICVNLNNDPENCGGCGNACEPGDPCIDGVCPLQCVGGTIRCDDVCVDLGFDPQHCGACGAACADDEVCSISQCAVDCSGGTTKCGNRCVDTELDPANCGACDIACSAGEVCSTGICAVNCGGGTIQCGSLCTNVLFDPENCGACENACASGVCSSASCVAPTSCKAYLDAAPAATDGVYSIDIDSTAPSAAFDVFCDMTTASGGWTLVYSYTFTAYSTFTLVNNAITPRPS